MRKDTAKVLVGLQVRNKRSHMAKWLLVLQEIPVIGPILSNIVFLAPPIFVTLLILLPISFVSVDFAARLTLLVFFGAVAFWVRLLENRAGLTMLLPIPIIKIPWEPVAWVGVSFGVYLFAIWNPA